jgi:uncharacterized membrane protein
MSWYALFRFLHIVSAIIFVGGLFARQVVRAYARKATDVKVFAELSLGAGRIERIMIIPGNMAVIIFGVIVAVMLNAPIFGFLEGATANWLLVSNLLLATGFIIVPFVFVPRGKIFDTILEKALAEGKITTDLLTALDDPVVKIAHIYEEVMVLVVVALMVFKPF